MKGGWVINLFPESKRSPAAVPAAPRSVPAGSANPARPCNSPAPAPPRAVFSLSNFPLKAPSAMLARVVTPAVAAPIAAVSVNTFVNSLVSSLPDDKGKLATLNVSTMA